MKQALCLVTTGLLACVLATNVRADGVPWSYSAPDTAILNSNNLLNSSSVAFTGGSGVANLDSGVIIYNVTSASIAVESSPDSFSNVPFTLAVTLTDIRALSSAVGVPETSGTVNFAGMFNATNVTSKSMLPAINTWTSPTTASLILGADDVGWRRYEVKLASFTSPGQPGGAPGSILAVVTIVPAFGPSGGEEAPPLTATPEPASLVLAGIGGFAFIGFAWRHRKRKLPRQI